MVSIRRTKTNVINRVFAIKTDVDGKRFTIDARNANLVCQEPSPLETPNPVHIAELYFDAGQTLFVAKYDVENYYRRFKVPL